MEVMTGLEATPDDAVSWRDGRLWLLDQRRLPESIEFLALDRSIEVAGAIRDMVVRGAPAIGIAAAYGVVLAARARYGESTERWRSSLQQDLEELAAARPTAVNLVWALQRLGSCLARFSGGDPTAALLDEAHAIRDEDRAANRRIGALGASLINERTAVLTHCNAGALATGGYGTALGVVRSAHAAGCVERVFADETRPWLQGARLTAWELLRSGIPVTVLVEGAAAALLRSGRVGWVVVGADRIAANGDVANKIGTYGLAVLARHHGVSFMVAAPASTVDLAVTNGSQIPIEQRALDEVLAFRGRAVAAPGSDAWNPVFDVTPAELVDAIVTERGIVRQPNAERMAEMMRTVGGPD